jgi:hydroxymethylbilane synthase
MKIRIGTRNSKLALIQTSIVIGEITKYFPQAECLVIPIITTGDKITDRNLYDIGGKALFLKEIEEQLSANEIDIGVHSLKDVPGVLPKGLEIAAVLKREDPRDCFVSFRYKSIEELPIGTKLGSSSVRRKILINAIRPDLEVVQFRGNVNTRLDKLRAGKVDAAILACSGLRRGEWFDPSFCFPIETHEMLPAAGQGIIGIEIKTDNEVMRAICAKINHESTWHLAKAERAFLSYLDANCRTPMSAHAIYQHDEIIARYMLSNLEGSKVEYCQKIGAISNAEELGIEAAKELQKLFS